MSFAKNNTCLGNRRISAIASSLLFAVCAAASAGNDQDVAQKQQQLDAVRAEIATISQSLQANQKAQSQYTRQIRDLDLQLNRKSRALRKLEAEIAENTATLRQLNSRRVELERSLNRHRQVLSEQLLAAYRMGKQEQLKMLLNQQDPSAVARALKYYEYLTRARADSIAVTKSTLDELTKTKAAILESKAALDALVARQKREVRQLASSRQEYQGLLVKLGAEAAAGRQSIASLKRDEAQIQELIAALNGLFADIPQDLSASMSFTDQKGRLPWPNTGNHMNHFDAPRPGSDMRWQGIRIQAQAGSEVQAISHGRIAFADWLPGFGLIMIIDHNNGYMSLYGNNEALYKETGDWVRAGETIASVGRSGGEQQSALYFEIRHNGKPVNPGAWCRSKRG